MLSSETRDAFQADGWVLSKSFFDSRIVSSIGTAIEKLESSANSALLQNKGFESCGLIVVPEKTDPSKVCRYEHVLGAHEEFRMCLVPIVQRYLEELCSEPLVIFKDKVNNKLPGGGEFRPHQDIVAYKAFPPRYYVTAMVSIDDTTIQNGCLCVASDYNRLAFENPSYVSERVLSKPIFNNIQGGEFHGDIHPEISSKFDWISLPTAKCDLLVIDSFIPHRSAHNASTSSRRALFITFSRASEGEWYNHYYEEKSRNPHDPKFHVSTPTSFRP